MPKCLLCGNKSKGNFKFKATTHAPEWDINIFYVANEQGNQRIVKPDLGKALLKAIRGLSPKPTSRLRRLPRRAMDEKLEVYPPRMYQTIGQCPSYEVVKVGPAAMHGSDLDLRPPSMLNYNPATIWYTNGSKQTSKGSDSIGAGVYNENEDVRLKIYADARRPSQTPELNLSPNS